MRRIFKRYSYNINQCKVVDVGSGLCDSSEFFMQTYPGTSVTCIDISDELVEVALQKGFVAINANITQIPYPDDTFDIVHCSHVLEHLRYPDVIHALDELVRIAKVNGLIIIRTPLIINHRFYNDIDHVRPYPPNAVLNYFSNIKQQKMSTYKVTEFARWYTRIYCELDYYKHYGPVCSLFNKILKLLWIIFGYPKAVPSNYGIVLKKML